MKLMMPCPVEVLTYPSITSVFHPYVVRLHRYIPSQSWPSGNQAATNTISLRSRYS